MTLFEKLCKHLLDEMRKNEEKHIQEIKSQEEKVIYLNDMKRVKKEITNESKNAVSE